MAIQGAAGKFLAGSGWDKLLSKSNVLTSGRASSALADSHVKRTRYAHQVSLAALHLLKLHTYGMYSDEYGPIEPFDIWDSRLYAGAPTFRYWNDVYEIELLMCRFVRAQREGDFRLYVQVLDEMCKWFFVLNRNKYSRWLPIHVKDLVGLEEQHPVIHEQFMAGNFVVQKSHSKFSMMAKDQSHEQCNKTLKSDGGPSGLLGDKESQAIIELSSIEVLRIVGEFEHLIHSADVNINHSEESKQFQQQFLTDVNNLRGEVLENGNPFLENEKELHTLDTQEVMPREVVESLKECKSLGLRAHEEYVQQRLIEKTVPISDTIRRKNLWTFDNRPSENKKGSSKLSNVKHNSNLVTKLFLSLQSRPESNMEDFFKFENQREPPSLSDNGNLRMGTKSHILQL